MKLQTIAFAFLAAAAVGGLAWVFIYPLLSGERQGAKRRASLSSADPVVAHSGDRNVRTRREQVEASLKEIEERNKQAQKVAIATRISQAGLNWSKQKFMIVSGILGITFFAIPFVV